MSEELLQRKMSKRLTTRRSVPTQTAVLTLALAAAVSLSCSQQARSLAKSDNDISAKSVPAKVSIVSDKEPGAPLIITGTIYAPDGQTPLEGINLFVYQTDATGVYSTSGNNGDNRDTRIHGAVRSGADGRYEFRTIKPGSYPASRNPAHIHAYVSGSNYPEYWIDEYHFSDDPFVTDGMRASAETGSFSSILKLTRGADGVLRGVRDIKVERCSRNCTGR